ncbi:MAG: hypothetical protein KF884_07260 [Fimbriimonadaceae bacterium]|nr:hypothetical protein [Fimbriimonadaceae bacterium]QYK57347.1 MAG: hypothetical protein KF884_07260 [Fimbriimonadaceae bacterium]
MTERCTTRSAVCPRTGWLELTQTYAADCWEAAGFAERALELLPEETPDVWAVPAHLETVRLSALVRLGERDAAERSLRRLQGWIGSTGIVTVETRQALGRFRSRFLDGHGS